LRIALGVGGGIAAYKAAELTRLLIQRGHTVQAILTGGAQEFITPLTFATLSGRKVITGLFSNSNPDATLASAVEHISVAQENDILLIAPATANVMSHFAHGFADDFLSTLYLAFTGPVVLAPAMNSNMWAHPATQANFETLRARGHVLVAPAEGFLACGMTGPGRLADPEDIADAVERALQPLTDYADETVLITAGPTQEPLDPVRFLSNHSSGKMGYALAQEAFSRGARVILVSGPVDLKAPRGVDVVPVKTAQEMRDAVFANLHGATMVIKCAAVADFHVASVPEHKIKKTMARLSMELEPTVDILAELGRNKGEWLLIGFAAETENLKQEAQRKLTEKNCDMIVGNLVGQSETGFESDNNEVLLVTKSGATEVPKATKREVAERILTEALTLRTEAPTLRTEALTLRHAS
jgi:phosphopantothenoylcysteine decarboxylase/phosphopantothenate--cysteine ligase